MILYIMQGIVPLNYGIAFHNHRAASYHVAWHSHFTVLLLCGTPPPDALMTTDHELHAEQQAVAEFNNVTQQFHAVLTCGRFTYTTDPPVSVEWLVILFCFHHIFHGPQLSLLTILKPSTCIYELPFITSTM
eukprot:TRINITY_DN3052_c0_g1_i11.p1 TRINITY_DN3052_c0_g1~~TRINITY_DN3052_c0_g1_i11.p1  ORF type:complete len:132 (+),score=13.62 TRINITY_DN3052_c0_g1_i11:622-1017(+)